MTRMWTRHGDGNCESVDASAFPIINHDLTIGPTTAVVTALRELVLQWLTDSRGLPKYAQVVQDIIFCGLSWWLENPRHRLLPYAGNGVFLTIPHWTDSPAFSETFTPSGQPPSSALHSSGRRAL